MVQKPPAAIKLFLTQNHICFSATAGIAKTQHNIALVLQ